jgi:hypothetical protein
MARFFIFRCDEEPPNQGGTAGVQIERSPLTGASAFCLLAQESERLSVFQEH